MSLRPLALSLMALMLAGCGREDAAPAIPPPGPGPAPATSPLQVQVFADPLEAKAYEALLEGYRQAQPGAAVELVAIGKQKDHMAKLTTAFAGGNPPDVFLLNFRRYGQFAAKGVLEPLGPRLTAQGRFDARDFYPQALEAFVHGGTLQCLPQNVSSLVVYYNRTLFQRYGVPTPAADWTWKDFTQAARRLTRSTEGDGRPELYGLAFDPTFVRVLPFVWQAGGALVDDLEQPTRFRLTERRALAGLAFLKSLAVRDRVVPPLAEHRAEGPEARFARGALGMLLHSRRHTATLRSLQGLDWDVAPLPRGAQAASVLHADGWCLAGSSPRKAEADRFLGYALSTEGQALLARSGRIVPSRRSVAESPAFLDPTQPPLHAQVFLDSIPTLQRTPNIAAWNEIETRVDPIVEEWFLEPPPAQMEDFGTDAIRLVRMINDAAQPLLDPTPQSKAQ